MAIPKLRNPAKIQVYTTDEARHQFHLLCVSNRTTASEVLRAEIDKIIEAGEIPGAKAKVEKPQPRKRVKNDGAK